MLSYINYLDVILCLMFSAYVSLSPNPDKQKEEEREEEEEEEEEAYHLLVCGLYHQCG